MRNQRDREKGRQRERGCEDPTTDRRTTLSGLCRRGFTTGSSVVCEIGMAARAGSRQGSFLIGLHCSAMIVVENSEVISEEAVGAERCGHGIVCHDQGNLIRIVAGAFSWDTWLLLWSLSEHECFKLHLSHSPSVFKSQ